MSKKFDEQAFYKKHPHVVKDSVKDAKVGSKVDGLVVVHPRICKIKCKESGKLRTIHTQDAHQVFYTVEIQTKKNYDRAAKRRKDKNGKNGTVKKEAKKNGKVKKETKPRVRRERKPKEQAVEQKAVVPPPPPPPLVPSN
jgi:hypothetical protein